jgi:hypothetical protein
VELLVAVKPRTSTQPPPQLPLSAAPSPSTPSAAAPPSFTNACMSAHGHLGEHRTPYLLWRPTLESWSRAELWVLAVATRRLARRW